jgi:SAM-dependent methyltransferase
MKFGEKYARAYDLLYVQKDYAAESRFVLQKLNERSQTVPLCVLDMGCGTGQHDIEFARAGLEITGLDLSDDMVRLASDRRAKAGPDLRQRLTFVQGDARSVRLGRKFDAVLALFHVMSYMAVDGDFEAALRSARAHLNPGGVLVFDFWHGAAVVAQPPERRERAVASETAIIKRITTPDWDPSKHLVSVRFDIEKTDLESNAVDTNSETHVMRYFFEAEIEKALEMTGFKLVELAEWLTGDVPSEKSFGVYAVAHAT